MRAITIIACLSVALASLGQVQIDKSVVLTASDSSQRQVLNIGSPTDAQDGISVKALRNGSIVHGTASGTNTLTINLEPAATSYVDGMMISFVASANNSDTVYVNVDGMGDVMLTRPDGLPLDPDDIRAGQVVTITYLNGKFILRDRTTELCPLGYVQVTESYCIQVNESGPLNWYDAAADCNDQGGRLCKWDEHYYACQRVDLNLQDMADNWEWIDDTSDHTHTADQVNRWQCKSQRSIGALVIETSEYRCCFTIR